MTAETEGEAERRKGILEIQPMWVRHSAELLQEQSQLRLTVIFNVYYFKASQTLNIV